jgi:phospholipase/lecithinase/hemolysin
MDNFLMFNMDKKIIKINGQELYELGARRIGVLSLPAIGCVPSQRTLADGIQRGCSKSANQAAILFNSKLSSQMDSLNNRLPDARLVYLDIYNPLLALIQNPAHYGNHHHHHFYCNSFDSLFCLLLLHVYNCNTKRVILIIF